MPYRGVEVMNFPNTVPPTITNKPVALLAGTAEEVMHWKRYEWKRDLYGDRIIWWVKSPEEAMGMEFSSVIMYGTWKSRDKADATLAEVKARIR